MSGFIHRKNCFTLIYLINGILRKTTPISLRRIHLLLNALTDGASYAPKSNDDLKVFIVNHQHYYEHDSENDTLRFAIHEKWPNCATEKEVVSKILHIIKEKKEPIHISQLPSIINDNLGQLSNDISMYLQMEDQKEKLISLIVNKSDELLLCGECVVLVDHNLLPSYRAKLNDILVEERGFISFVDPLLFRATINVINKDTSATETIFLDKKIITDDVKLTVKTFLVFDAVPVAGDQPYKYQATYVRNQFEGQGYFFSSDADSTKRMDKTRKHIETITFENRVLGSVAEEANSNEELDTKIGEENQNLKRSKDEADKKFPTTLVGETGRLKKITKTFIVAECCNSLEKVYINKSIFPNGSFQNCKSGQNIKFNACLGPEGKLCKWLATSVHLQHEQEMTHETEGSDEDFDKSDIQESLTDKEESSNEDVCSVNEVHDHESKLTEETGKFTKVTKVFGIAERSYNNESVYINQSVFEDDSFSNCKEGMKVKFNAVLGPEGKACKWVATSVHLLTQREENRDSDDKDDDAPATLNNTKVREVPFWEHGVHCAHVVRIITEVLSQTCSLDIDRLHALLKAILTRDVLEPVSSMEKLRAFLLNHTAYFSLDEQNKNVHLSYVKQNNLNKCLLADISTIIKTSFIGDQDGVDLLEITNYLDAKNSISVVEKLYSVLAMLTDTFLVCKGKVHTAPEKQVSVNLNYFVGKPGFIFYVAEDHGTAKVFIERSGNIERVWFSKVDTRNLSQEQNLLYECYPKYSQVMVDAIAAPRGKKFKWIATHMEPLYVHDMPTEDRKCVEVSDEDLKQWKISLLEKINQILVNNIDSSSQGESTNNIDTKSSSYCKSETVSSHSELCDTVQKEQEIDKESETGVMQETTEEAISKVEVAKEIKKQDSPDTDLKTELLQSYIDELEAKVRTLEETSAALQTENQSKSESINQLMTYVQQLSRQNEDLQNKIDLIENTQSKSRTVMEVSQTSVGVQTKSTGPVMATKYYQLEEEIT